MHALDEIDEMLMRPQVNDLHEIDNLLAVNNPRIGNNYDRIAENLGLANWEPGMSNMAGGGRGRGRGRGGDGRGRGRGRGRGASNGRGQRRNI